MGEKKEFIWTDILVCLTPSLFSGSSHLRVFVKRSPLVQPQQFGTGCWSCTSLTVNKLPSGRWNKVFRALFIYCFTDPLDKYLKGSSPNQGGLDCSVWVEMQHFQYFKSQYAWQSKFILIFKLLCKPHYTTYMGT